MAVELGQYNLIRWAVSGSTVYTGSVARDGRWVVTKYDTSAGTVTYCRGSVGFSTNWTSRASLSYSEFDTEF